jgi:hypothetical protein
MLELIIIGLIVAAVLYAGGRSLWRTWAGKNAGGCAGCGGCASSKTCGAADVRPWRQNEVTDSVKQSRKETQR